MTGLGLLSLLGLKAFVGIGNAIVDARDMSTPSGYLNDGTPYYANRKNETFVNGEKLISKVAYEPDGTLYLQRVGERTGKVYVDPYQIKREKSERYSEKLKEMELKHGYKAYRHFHPIWKEEVTREISTGKYIGELKGTEDGKFYVRYLDENTPIKPLNSEWIEEREITQEEYDKLNIACGTHYASDLYRNTYIWDKRKKKYILVPKKI